MMNRYNYTDVVRKIIAFKGVDKDYWAGVSIVKEHSGLTETEMIILDEGLSVKSRQIIAENIEKLRKEAQEISDLVKIEEKKAKAKK